MKLWNDLLVRLGRKREAGTRRVELDKNLQKKIRDLAEWEHRPEEEVGMELIRLGMEDWMRRDKWVRLWEDLSDREKQVVALTCLGYTNPEIAEQLCISVLTVSSHVKRAGIKFGVNGKMGIRQVLKEWDFSEWDK